ncbi:MAG: hypothetical protein WKF48_05670 [Solirubrobacteraceae bacterium]
MPSLAACIGINEAIVLQQIHYLSIQPRSDGWVDLTVAEWIAEYVLWLSPATLERIFRRLRERRLVVGEALPRGRDGGRRTRYRIDHGALDALFDGSATTHQSDGNPAINLIGSLPSNRWLPNHHIDGSSCIGDSREKLKKTASLSVADTITDPDLDEVFEAWVKSGASQGKSIFDAKLRRIVLRAITNRMAHPENDKRAAIDECCDAVRGWRWSPHHRGENKDGRPFNSLQILLRDNQQIQDFRDLERRHGATAGNLAAAPCPGLVLPVEIAELWPPIAADLRLAVPDGEHDIWLSTLHLHGEHDGGLIFGIAPEVSTWVSGRFIDVIRHASSGRNVSVVECALGRAPAAAEAAA